MKQLNLRHKKVKCALITRLYNFLYTGEVNRFHIFLHTSLVQCNPALLSISTTSSYSENTSQRILSKVQSASLPSAFFVHTSTKLLANAMVLMLARRGLATLDYFCRIINVDQKVKRRTPDISKASDSVTKENGSHIHHRLEHSYLGSKRTPMDRLLVQLP